MDDSISQDCHCQTSKGIPHIWKNSEAHKFWRNKVQRDVKSARSKYFRKSVEKLNEVNPSRWWREVKSVGGLKSSDVWYHHLLSDENPTLTHLAESYNNFLVNLTSHFNPLLPIHDAEILDPPNEFRSMHLFVKLNQ